MARAFEDRLRADRSPAMVRRVMGVLGSILADAQERGLVAQNVVRSLRGSRRRDKDRHADKRQKGKLKVGVEIPTPDEIRAIIAHLHGRRRPMLLTAIFTGLRASELRGLRWADIDLKRGELHVRQRADRFNTIGRPKSEVRRAHRPARTNAGEHPTRMEARLPQERPRSGLPERPRQHRSPHQHCEVSADNRPRSRRAWSTRRVRRSIPACMPCAISTPRE